MLYLDSSVLLADYLDQPAAAWARSVWTRDDELVSSFLLLAEVPVVLRRALAAAKPTAAAARALAARLERFDADAARISILLDAEAVVSLVRKDARFARVRTLDALHAAAAWDFQALSGTTVTVLTADLRLAEACRLIGLPAETPPVRRGARRPGRRSGASRPRTDEE